ncbi:MAG: hypothetical protein J0I77_08580 [Rudaea sp.]|uniref:hypothetical protein n=1 Tax=unclassified Rudaea TaxID=2627037 RepID=UPI0014852795|nr:MULTISPECIES: hypothetical protein [unclassified Rudaea]MBN8885761.1 hypothetical protein [Rudaea sp.]
MPGQMAMEIERTALGSADRVEPADDMDVRSPGSARWRHQRIQTIKYGANRSTITPLNHRQIKSVTALRTQFRNFRVIAIQHTGTLNRSERGHKKVDIKQHFSRDQRFSRIAYLLRLQFTQDLFRLISLARLEQNSGARENVPLLQTQVQSSVRIHGLHSAPSRMQTIRRHAPRGRRKCLKAAAPLQYDPIRRMGDTEQRSVNAYSVALPQYGTEPNEMIKLPPVTIAALPCQANVQMRH